MSRSEAPVSNESPPRRPWAEDVVYMILVDRFHRAPGGPEPALPWKGGNLRGVLEKLDDLEDLGVSALWISPVYANQRDGYHGYWPVDFFAVDERFGTLEDLVALVRECHRRGMKVLLDMVLNHTGYDHPMARDPKKRGWFHHSGDIRWFDQKSLERGSLHGLPDLAQENPEVAKYLIEMGLWWIEKTGIDGFRLDAVKHVPSGFWREFSAEIHRRAGPDSLLLGEVFRGVPSYIARYQRQDGIDSVFDVPFADCVRSALSHDSDVRGPSLVGRLLELKREYKTMLVNEILRKLKTNRPTDMTHFSELFAADRAYVRPSHLATVIDNHDLSRFVSEADRPERLELALALLMTWRGIPVLTYGTEVGLAGRTTDDSNRAMMPFGANPRLTELTKKLIRLRRTTPALARGVQVEVFANRHVYAFLREADGERALVVLNNSREVRSRTLTLPAWIGWDGEWRDALSGETLAASKGRLHLDLPRRSARILVSGASTRRDS